MPDAPKISGPSAIFQGFATQTVKWSSSAASGAWEVTACPDATYIGSYYDSGVLANNQPVYVKDSNPSALRYLYYTATTGGGSPCTVTTNPHSWSNQWFLFDGVKAQSGPPCTGSFYNQNATLAGGQAWTSTGPVGTTTVIQGTASGGITDIFRWQFVQGTIGNVSPSGGTWLGSDSTNSVSLNTLGAGNWVLFVQELTETANVWTDSAEFAITVNPFVSAPLISGLASFDATITSTFRWDSWKFLVSNDSSQTDVGGIYVARSVSDHDSRVYRRADREDRFLNWNTYWNSWVFYNTLSSSSSSAWWYVNAGGRDNPNFSGVTWSSYNAVSPAPSSVTRPSRSFRYQFVRNESGTAQPDNGKWEGNSTSATSVSRRFVEGVWTLFVQEQAGGSDWSTSGTLNFSVTAATAPLVSGLTNFNALNGKFRWDGTWRFNVTSTNSAVADVAGIYEARTIEDHEARIYRRADRNDRYLFFSGSQWWLNSSYTTSGAWWYVNAGRDVDITGLTWVVSGQLVPLPTVVRSNSITTGDYRLQIRPGTLATTPDPDPLAWQATSATNMSITNKPDGQFVFFLEQQAFADVYRVSGLVFDSTAIPHVDFVLVPEQTSEGKPYYQGDIDGETYFIHYVTDSWVLSPTLGDDTDMIASIESNDETPPLGGWVFDEINTDFDDSVPVISFIWSNTRKIAYTQTTAAPTITQKWVGSPIYSTRFFGTFEWTSSYFGWRLNVGPDSGYDRTNPSAIIAGTYVSRSLEDFNSRIFRRADRNDRFLYWRSGNTRWDLGDTYNGGTTWYTNTATNNMNTMPTTTWNTGTSPGVAPVPVVTGTSNILTGNFRWQIIPDTVSDEPSSGRWNLTTGTSVDPKIRVPGNYVLIMQEELPGGGDNEGYRFSGFTIDETPNGDYVYFGMSNGKPYYKHLTENMYVAWSPNNGTGLWTLSTVLQGLVPDPQYTVAWIASSADAPPTGAWSGAGDWVGQTPSLLFVEETKMWSAENRHTFTAIDASYPAPVVSGPPLINTTFGVWSWGSSNNYGQKVTVTGFTMSYTSNGVLYDSSWNGTYEPVGENVWKMVGRSDRWFYRISWSGTSYYVFHNMHNTNLTTWWGAYSNNSYPTTPPTGNVSFYLSGWSSFTVTLTWSALTSLTTNTFQHAFTSPSNLVPDWVPSSNSSTTSVTQYGFFTEGGRILNVREGLLPSITDDKILVSGNLTYIGNLMSGIYNKSTAVNGSPTWVHELDSRISFRRVTTSGGQWTLQLEGVTIASVAFNSDDVPPNSGWSYDPVAIGTMDVGTIYQWTETKQFLFDVEWTPALAPNIPITAGNGTYGSDRNPTDMSDMSDNSGPIANQEFTATGNAGWPVSNSDFARGFDTGSFQWRIDSGLWTDFERTVTVTGDAVSSSGQALNGVYRRSVFAAGMSFVGPTVRYIDRPWIREGGGAVIFYSEANGAWAISSIDGTTPNWASRDSSATPTIDSMPATTGWSATIGGTGTVVVAAATNAWFRIPTLAVGSYTLEVRSITDAVPHGGPHSLPASITLQIYRMVAPVVTVDTVRDDGWFVPISWEAQSGPAIASSANNTGWREYRYRINGGPWSPQSNYRGGGFNANGPNNPAANPVTTVGNRPNIHTLQLPKGSNLFEVQERSRGGGWSATGSATINVVDGFEYKEYPAPPADHRIIVKNSAGVELLWTFKPGVQFPPTYTIVTQEIGEE